VNGIVSWTTAALVAGGLLVAPTRGAAQTTAPSDGWKVDIAPLYLWASEMDGSMAVGARTVPIFMDFGSAVEKLSATFTFDGKIQKGRWGAFGNIGFVRLATDADFEVGTSGNPATGRLELDNVIFEGGGSLHVTPDFAVIGGVRTYTFSPNIQLGVSDTTVGEVDASKTNVDGFGGITWRPWISSKWQFHSRGDIGAGESAFTWSGLVALEYALGINTGDTRTLAAAPSGSGNALATRYQVTHYGPVFAGTFHWGH
jgi:hypothetical protein